jgi:hypothetical protein
MDAFVCSLYNKVFGMLDFQSKSRFEYQKRQMDPVSRDVVSDDDLTMEQILENINNTPLGQVLKKIALLPEKSQQKVLNVRRQLTEGKYDLSERLDIVLDKVLEDLTS